MEWQYDWEFYDAYNANPSYNGVPMPVLLQLMETQYKTMLSAFGKKTFVASYKNSP